MRLALLFLAAVCAQAQFFPFPGPGTVAHSGGGGGAITQVQKKTFASTASSTSCPITFNAAPVSGHLLILTVVSDTTVNTPAGWSLAVSAVNFVGEYIYYKISAGTETTVTIGLTSSDSCTVTGFEYSNMAASSPLDKTAFNNSASGAATTISTGTTTTTSQANELVVAVVGWNDTIPTISSWSNSFVSQSSLASTGSATNITQGTSAKVVSTTGTQTTTATLSTDCGFPSGAIATFKGL